MQKAVGEGRPSAPRGSDPSALSRKRKVGGEFSGGARHQREAPRGLWVVRSLGARGDEQGDRTLTAPTAGARARALHHLSHGARALSDHLRDFAIGHPETKANVHGLLML